MPREITLPPPDGHTYSIGTLDAMQQWVIAKRFMTQVQKEKDAWESAERNAGRNPEDYTWKDYEGVVHNGFKEPPLNFVLSGMSDEDSGKVISTALTAVQRKGDNGAWSPVLTLGTSRLQFSDMKMEALIALTFAVMKDNIDSFFTTEQPDLTAPKTA